MSNKSTYDRCIWENFENSVLVGNDFLYFDIHSIGSALIVALFGDKTGNTARIYFFKFSYTLLSVNNKLYSKTQNFSDSHDPCLLVL